MTENALAPGMVPWPSGSAERNRLCVLISDVHCTDCTVGNQTASETDWQEFFEQVEYAVRNPGDKAQTPPAQRIDELMLILNGDIVDLVRSSKWAEAGVYPWQREDARFEELVLAIMRDIVTIHAVARQQSDSSAFDPQWDEQYAHSEQAGAIRATQATHPAERLERGTEPYSGFFYWMRACLNRLRKDGVVVHVVPVVGNHDKELQVVPAARQMYYEECLGLTAIDIPDSYRAWVAAQLGTSPDDLYPCLPFYVADAGFRLLATHGQWRDKDNARCTSHWKPSNGWAPECWRRDQYRAFSDSCFGDTVAAAMLSHFIWSVTARIDKSMPGARRICNLLDEMDLYRPSVSAVVRLLAESRRAAQRAPEARGLHELVLGCFRASLVGWLGQQETWASATGTTRLGLATLYLLTRFKWYWLDISLMRLMAKVQEPESDIKTKTLLGLPAFLPENRMLGLRLHVEGHTHVALEAELQFHKPRFGRNNYTYVNLGAWRDAILPKRNRGYRRRGIGRALFVFDLARDTAAEPDDRYRFYARDVISWGDRLDSW